VTNSHRYADVRNNPIMFNDPTGMEGKPVSDSPTTILNNIDISKIAPQYGGGNDNPSGGNSENIINSIKPTGNETKSSSKPPRISSVNFGLFTLTFRKSRSKDATNLPKRSVTFDWNYTLSKETSEKKVWRKKSFVFNNKQISGAQSTPLNITYPTITVGGGTTDFGSAGVQTLEDFISKPNITKYVIISASIGTKRNDHGGDSFYQLNVGGNVINHQNSNRKTSIDPKSISIKTVVNASLVRETPARDGMYDQCNGYRLTVKIQYERTKTINRLRIVRKAPNL